MTSERDEQRARGMIPIWPWWVYALLVGGFVGGVLFALRASDVDLTLPIVLIVVGGGLLTVGGAILKDRAFNWGRGKYLQRRAEDQ